MKHKTRLVCALISSVIILSGTTSLLARISISTYLADTNDLIPWVDPNTPYVFPEMMAGTELTLVLESNEPGRWMGGSIFIFESFWDQGQLFARDWDNRPGDYESSITEFAGSRAKIIESVGEKRGESQIGYQFVGDRNAIAGPWFIIDCNTYSPGDCLVTMDDFDVSRNEAAFEMLIPLVPSRDYDQDHLVNFKDFAVLANQWQKAPHVNLYDPNTWPQNRFFDPNNPSPLVDLNRNDLVDTPDLGMFSHFWLQRTSGNTGESTDPNSMNNGFDENNLSF